jgi:hypothetical protein
MTEPDATHGDHDFVGLRTDIEEATRLPEFDRVARRARRVRRRDLGRRLVITLAVVGALIPAGVAGWNAAPRSPAVQGRDPIGPDRPDPTPAPTPSTAAVATIRAIAGAKIGALYAAVDVCRPSARQSNCSLQVVPLGATAQDQRGPIAVGELRDDPTDSLDEVTLQSVTPHALLLSGIRRDGERKYRRINLRGGGAEIAPEPSAGSLPMAGDQAVQLTRYGQLNFIRQADARVVPTPVQPKIDDPVLVTSVAPDDGWWATGVDPVTHEAAVAVSHDLGINWVVTSLGLTPGMADPVLTTADGDTAYVFVRTSTGIQQRLTTDGGLTWQTVTTMMPWPQFATGDVVDRKLGAVVRGDGSLLVWVEEPPGAVFLESTDLGNSYRPVTGPSGPIVAVQDGFVAVGDPPLVSFDGHTWSALPRPAVVSPTE